MRRARRLERAFWASHSRNWDDSLADERVVDHIEHLSALLLAATVAGHRLTPHSTVVVARRR